MVGPPLRLALLEVSDKAEHGAHVGDGFAQVIAAGRVVADAQGTAGKLGVLGNQDELLGGSVARSVVRVVEV